MVPEMIGCRIEIGLKRIFPSKRAAFQRKWDGSRDDWFQDKDWCKNHVFLSKGAAIRKETGSFWTNLDPGTNHLYLGSVAEIIGSRIEICPKTFYFFRNEPRSGGNRKFLDQSLSWN